MHGLPLLAYSSVKGGVTGLMAVADVAQVLGCLALGAALILPTNWGGCLREYYGRHGTGCFALATEITWQKRHASGPSANGANWLRPSVSVEKSQRPLEVPH